MKRLGSFCRLSKRNILATILVIACVPVLSPAQQQSLQVISGYSTASLFLGTRDNPTSINIGIARVRGEVQIALDHPNSSHFDFTIYSANQIPPADSNNQNGYGDQPVISFHSQDVKQREDGTLEVRGQLTVIQAYRQVVASLGEDYSGLVYGPATLFRTSREATFVFGGLNGSTPASTSGDVRMVPAQLNQPESDMLLTATAKVEGETFPELSRSIQEVAWPILVQDEKCITPTTAGEDYSGPACTGTAVQPAPSPVLLVQTGEDYSGIQVLPPAGDQVTIQLRLKLANKDRSSIVGPHQQSAP